MQQLCFTDFMMIRNLFQIFVLSILLSSSKLPAEILETSHFAELVEHATPETFVLVDIDDTLLLPTQTLGTDVWFIHRTNYYITSGIERKEALEMAITDWEAVRHLTKVKIVEAESDRIIKELQQKKITLMGLTTQGLALSTLTTRQLHSLNIDLSVTAPSPEEYYFMNGHGVLYRNGLLSTSGTPKGPALMKFLDMIGYKPQHIVFINDKATHLKDVEESVVARGIKFTGLRYNFSDERVKNFDPEIAEIQWKNSTLDHLLSDEEALSQKR